MDPIVVLILVAIAVGMALWFADEIRGFIAWLVTAIVDLLIGGCIVVAVCAVAWFLWIR